MPLKPHPTDPEKMVYVKSKYRNPEETWDEPRTWVGLTDEEMTLIYVELKTGVGDMTDTAKAFDAVAALTEDGWIWDGDQWQRPPQQEAPLPQRPWVGLTEDEAIELLPVGNWEIESTLEFAKAVEAKLKEKNT